MFSTVAGLSPNTWMYSTLSHLLFFSTAFAVVAFEEYEYSGDGEEEDECWYGSCHPDVRFADGVDCIRCPEVSMSKVV